MNFRKITAFSLSLALMAGSVALPEEISTDGISSSVSITANASATRYEAENAVLAENSSVENKQISGVSFSGGKYVALKNMDKTSLDFNVNLSEGGTYRITSATYGEHGKKEYNISVDGNCVAEKLLSGDKEYNISEVENVSLSAGKHTISIMSGSGWFDSDYIELERTGGDVYDVSNTLSNENATQSTKLLYSYLCKAYGSRVLTGQQCDGGINGTEFKKIKNITGKTPAILGLDFMRYSPSRQALGEKSDGAVDKAIEFAEKGGIVTFCWHWNAPTKYLKSTADNSSGWWGGFYKDHVKISEMHLDKMISGEDREGYNFLVNEIDAIAKQLKILQNNDVPVLFRPLHEGSGGWFWWGAYGSETYKKLWKFMYTRLTDYHKLNNLIWVYNGQSKDWYPGDEYVDIIGEDIYQNKKDYSPQTAKFNQATAYPTSNKPVALTENGCLFDIDKAFSANTKWLWFCTWSGDYATSSAYSEDNMWRKVYGNSKAITLENLNWRTSDPTKSVNEPIEIVEPVSLSKTKITLKGTCFTYTGKSIRPDMVVKYGNKTLVQGKDYTVTYYNNKVVGQAKVAIKGKGDYTGTVNKYYTIIPSVPKGKFVSSTSATVKISWTKASGADTYAVYQYNKGKWVKVKTTSSLSATFTKLKSGSNYYFKVKAYRKNSGINYSRTFAQINTVTRPQKATVSVKSTSARTVTTSWKKVSGANGYQFQITPYSSMKNGLYYKTKSTSKTVKKLSRGRKYYVRVRAYKILNGKTYYGSWSSVKSIKAK